MYAAPVDCIAASAHTARSPTNHGDASPIVLIKYGTRFPYPPVPIDSGSTFDIFTPAAFTTGSAPKICAPIP